MLYYKIICGDSRQMPEVQSNVADLVVTSPPYWTLDVFSKEGDVGQEGDLSRYHSKKSFFTEITKTWKECERVLKPGGVLVCQWEDFPPGSRYTGYMNEICLVGPMVKSIEDAGLTLFSRWFVRKFEPGVAVEKFPYTLYGNLKTAYPRAVANVSYAFAFYKREYNVTHFPRKVDFTREEWAEWSDGVWNINFLGTGLDISGGATYPVEFAKRCIKLFTNKGDTVLEPFLGTGTTMRAAYELERSCIGFEVLERMLPTIKQKVHFGTAGMFEPVQWELKNRYKEVK